MDAAVPMTATGLALVWPLLGFLLLWMILFGVLAFRPERKKENAHSPSASAMLHVIAPLSPANVIGQSAPDSSNN